MTKGGSFRQWFGNNEYVLNFQNDGEELKYWLVHNPNDPTTKSYSRYIRNYENYCKSGISFADVNSGSTNFRFQPCGFIPNARGPYIYSTSKTLLGYLNTNIPNVEKLEAETFNFCSALTSVSLQNCKYVDGYAFNHCGKLSSLDLPICEYIGGYAF